MNEACADVPAGPATAAVDGEVHTYPMAPLIRFTLLTLYLALVAPLPLLAPHPLRGMVALAVAGGLVLVAAVTSEQVRLDHRGMAVGHPAWCAWLLRRGWSLSWDRVVGLTPVPTSQGGRVFYVRSAGPDDGCRLPRAHLLPQRVARFEDFLVRFRQATGLPTEEIGRISPAWTYRLLAVLSGLMLASEMLVLMLASGQGLPSH